MGDRWQRVLDAAVVAGLVALSLSLVLGAAGAEGNRLVQAVLVLAHLVPLWFRRRTPVAVLGSMVATGLLSVLLGVPAVLLGPGVLVAVYAVAARCEPTQARPAVVAATVAMSAVVLANGMEWSTVLTNALAFGTTWWLGDRARRATAETAAQRAAAAEAARRAASEERVRIARELHDVVAHAMSVIAVQAGTGRFVIEESPDVARDALASIETTSRAAMQEMRRLLAVLRDDADGGPDLVPAPGLADVEALVAGGAAAGVCVALNVEGERRPLPAGVDLCAYRIIQEALTNVRKHAAATTAAVTLRYTPSAVDIDVVDDGAGAAAPAGAGHGLVGMRERAALYGGWVEAGAVPAGGYRVHASIPLSEES